MSDRDILHHYAVTTNDPATGDTGPTLAGILTLGDHPKGVTEAARVTYNRHPRATDPPGSRHAGTHLEGTVGELLDAAMDRLAQDLDTVQVMRGAGLYDELDVPREALREVLSNALMHRSFGTRPAQHSGGCSRGTAAPGGRRCTAPHARPPPPRLGPQP
jgi:predicted HTH transcriptional regulator